MKERFKIIPEVFLMLVKDGQILLSRRFQTGYEDGNYSLPAGHVEDRESMREGMVREAKEEIGIDIKVDDLKHVVTMHRWCPDAGKNAPHSRIGFYFTPLRYDGEPTNMEPDRCDDIRYFPLDQLPENIIPNIREAIRCYKEGISYLDYDWDTRRDVQKV